MFINNNKANQEHQPHSLLLNPTEVKTRALKNLGTFSTTCMIKQAEDLFKQYASMNAVDNCAYPELEKLVEKCGHFLLSLFHAQQPENYSFFPTSGSSEAIFLSLLLMKHHWMSTYSHTQEKPNFIVGPTSHVAFYAATKSLDIEIRILSFDENHLTYNQENIHEMLDANTIGFCCTLGATSNLVMDDVNQLNALLSKYYQKTGHFVPIHVDAASGGFIAPFYYPRLEWDFRLTHVKAINVSSHKYGLVYPSLGWLCMDNAYCLSELAHESSYLGKTFKRFPLQFSHSAAHIAAQYYNIEVLGETGYQKITKDLYQQLHTLVAKMKEMGHFHFITPNALPAVPGIVFTLNENKDINAFARFLAQRGWHLPTFQYPHTPQHAKAARIMLRYGFTEALMKALLADMVHFFEG